MFNGRTFTAHRINYLYSEASPTGYDVAIIHRERATPGCRFFTEKNQSGVGHRSLNSDVPWPRTTGRQILWVVKRQFYISKSA